jgi:hypothetical protein
LALVTAADRCADRESSSKSDERADGGLDRSRRPEGADERHEKNDRIMVAGEEGFVRP